MLIVFFIGLYAGIQLTITNTQQKEVIMKNLKINGLPIKIENTKVTLENVQITNINYEDALYIKNGNFQLTNVTITNTTGDCFDTDYSEGEVQNLKTQNCGDETIDLQKTTIGIK